MYASLISLAVTLLSLLGEKWVIEFAAQIMLWWRTAASDDLRRKVDERFNALQSNWDEIRKNDPPH